MTSVPPARLVGRAACRRLMVLAALATAAGCSQFPEVDAFAASQATGPAPALLPLDQVLAADAAPARAADAGEALAARAALLKARAALMRGPVPDPATRDRLGAAVAAGGA